MNGIHIIPPTWRNEKEVTLIRENYAMRAQSTFLPLSLIFYNVGVKPSSSHKTSKNKTKKWNLVPLSNKIDSKWKTRLCKEDFVYLDSQVNSSYNGEVEIERNIAAVSFLFRNISEAVFCLKPRRSEYIRPDLTYDSAGWGQVKLFSSLRRDATYL